MTVVVILLAVALAVALMAGAFLLAGNRQLRGRTVELLSQLVERDALLTQREQRIAQLQDELARQMNELTAARTKLEGLDDRFKALAGEVLDQQGKRFLDLAQKSLKGEQQEATHQLEQRKQAIEAMLKPVREALDKQAVATQEIEKQRHSAYSGLREHLARLHEAQDKLAHQTTALTTALKGSSSARGRWGELTLKRIAELAGMVAYCDFDEQVTMWKGDQAQRPDMVVRLPSQRSIVIDAKSVGANFLAALEARDDAERAKFFNDHLRDIESRVRDLSAKAYSEQLERTPDFVILFLPGESFLQPAMELKPDLMQTAMARGVVIATPTILMSLLRVVELGWREERMAKNAQKVRDLGIELHERVATITGYLMDLGEKMESSVKAYNKLVGSYETRVLVTTRKLKDLGANSSKVLPDEDVLAPLEAQVRLPLVNEERAGG